MGSTKNLHLESKSLTRKQRTQTLKFPSWENTMCNREIQRRKKRGKGSANAPSLKTFKRKYVLIYNIKISYLYLILISSSTDPSRFMLIKAIRWLENYMTKNGLKVIRMNEQLITHHQMYMSHSNLKKYTMRICYKK